MNSITHLLSLSINNWRNNYETYIARMAVSIAEKRLYRLGIDVDDLRKPVSTELFNKQSMSSTKPKVCCAKQSMSSTKPKVYLKDDFLNLRYVLCANSHKRPNTSPINQNKKNISFPNTLLDLVNISHYNRLGLTGGILS